MIEIILWVVLAVAGFAAAVWVLAVFAVDDTGPPSWAGAGPGR